MSHFASVSSQQTAVVSLRMSPGGRAVLRVAAIVVIAIVPTLARSEVEWHADLPTAHAAARISHRPVLAVFVANWGETAKSVERRCLASREAEAVLATCFEPVRIDIDEQQALTRAAGVTHVPAACVLADDDTVLTSFEMSGPPAAFVTAAILAAQGVANSESHAIAASGVERDTTTSAAATSAPMTAAAFGSRDDAGAGQPRSHRGSMARVAAKVRDLSAFATGQSRTMMAAAPAPTAIAPVSQTVSDPRSDYQPLSWPAETASAAPTAPAPPPAATIEPTATALTPTTVSPWLDSAARQPPTAPPAPPVQASAPRPAEPQPAEAPRQSSLIAALQKPFGFGAKPAAEPPTMPPAQPQSPLAATMPAVPPAASPANPLPAAEPDVHGSMPLGLEGYCPVTLVDRGSWTEGRAQWGARHRGRTYLFAGPDEQRTFLADPDRYAPALSGDDPVLAMDGGASTPGQRRYGVTYQSRIYLFATPESRTAFTADPTRYTTRVMVAERTPSAAAGTRTY